MFWIINKSIHGISLRYLQETVVLFIHSKGMKRVTAHLWEYQTGLAHKVSLTSAENHFTPCCWGSAFSISVHFL